MCYHVGVMASCTLEIADEKDPSICLASYSNGRLNITADNKTKVRHTLYKEKDGGITVKGRSVRKTLVTKTDHLTYVGKNYETEGIRNTQNFRKYMVGVLDKETGVMKLHKADIFHMMPYIKGRTDSISVETATPTKKPFNREEYSQSLDKVLTSFGSSKAKKAWSTAKRNKIDSSKLDTSLAPAVSHAEEEMERIHENDDTSTSANTTGPIAASSYIPLCNTNATSPDEVYQLNDLISAEEMSLLEEPAMNIMEQTREALRAKGSYSQFFLTNFTPGTSSSVRLRKISMLIYCNSLIAMYKTLPKTIQKFGLTRTFGIPIVIQESLLNKFTEHGPSGASANCAFTTRMKDKVVAYLLAIALRICDYSVSSYMIQSDLQISSNKIVTVSRALGCTLVEDKLHSQKGQKCYEIVLKVPLVFKIPGKMSGRKRKL